jgi:AcrR family transcriptional regulator
MSLEVEDTAVKSLRRDAAENRTRLLDAAAQVFAEGGLDASVEEVARVAGVGMGTLYRRFPTKDALIAQLVRDLLQEVLDLARAAAERKDGTGLETFLFACGAVQASRRGCLSRLWNDPDSVAIKNECRAAISILVDDAREHGQIRADATRTDIDLIFWSLRAVIEVSAGVSETGWRRHVAIMIAGLRPSAAPLSEPALTEAMSDEIRDLTRRS